MQTTHFQHNQFLVVLGDVDESNFIDYLAVGDEL